MVTFCGQDKFAKLYKLGLDKKMNVVIEIEKEQAKFAQRKKIYTGGLILSIVLFLLGATLMVVLSPDEYDFWQWILIGLATIYIWGLIYFVSVPYKTVRQYEAFYRSYTRGIVEHEKLTIIAHDTDIKINKNGLEVTTLKTTFVDKNKSFERDVYVLSNNISLSAGTNIRAHLFCNVLLGYEVLE